MRTISNSNYHQDDLEFLSDFLDISLKNRCFSTHYVNDININVAIPIYLVNQFI